jgi:hypothetical protein
MRSELLVDSEPSIAVLSDSYWKTQAGSKQSVFRVRPQDPAASARVSSFPQEISVDILMSRKRITAVANPFGNVASKLA